MRKLHILVIAVALFCAMSAPLSAKEIGGLDVDITLDFTYASKYMWHGYDVFNGDGSYMPSIELGTNGFYVGFWAAFPSSSGYEDLTEFDYYVGYGYTFFEDQTYALETSITYTYFDFPKTASAADASELALSFSMPNLLPLGPANLVPSYTMYYDFEGIDSTNFDDGFFNTFGLSYSLPITPFLEGQEEQALDFGFDITHDDGVYGAKSGWSYATIGVSTTYEYKGAYFTPGMYYQMKLDDVAPGKIDDDFYATFSIGYAF
jgi:hypothetical protein